MSNASSAPISGNMARKSALVMDLKEPDSDEELVSPS
jgi:hypothetical protein